MEETKPDLKESWGNAWSKVAGWVDGFYVLLPNLVVGAMVVAFLIVVGLALRWSIERSFARRGRDNLGDMLSDFVFWAVVLFGVLLALTIVLPSLKPGDLIAGLGVGSVAIGFAFKDILQNWLAGLLILMRQPFRRGDQIEIGAVAGTVERIDQRATLIKTFDGRLVVIPNADVYTQSVTVDTAFKIRRIAIDLTVGYDNDIGKVRDVLLRAISGIDEIKQEPPPQVLCWELGPTSLAIKVRFWIESRRSSEISARARAVQAIKEAFQSNGIDPTDPQIVYMHEIGSRQRSDVVETRRPNGASKPPPPIAMSPGDPESDHVREGRAGTML